MEEEEDDDDIYAVDRNARSEATAPPRNGVDHSDQKTVDNANEDEEEGEEVEEEGSDSVRAKPSNASRLL